MNFGSGSINGASAQFNIDSSLDKNKSLDQEGQIKKLLEINEAAIEEMKYDSHAFGSKDKQGYESGFSKENDSGENSSDEELEYLLMSINHQRPTKLSTSCQKEYLKYFDSKNKNKLVGNQFQEIKEL